MRAEEPSAASLSLCGLLKVTSPDAGLETISARRSEPSSVPLLTRRSRRRSRMAPLGKFRPGRATRAA